MNPSYAYKFLFVLFSCCSLLSVEKNFFIFIFSLFFVLNNIGKSCAPFKEIFSSRDKFLHDKVLPSNPHPSTPSLSNKKIPLKMYVHSLITITICKHCSKVVTCSPSPGDCEGVSRPQRYSYLVIWLCWTKWLSQNFDQLTLRKKWAWGGSRYPPIFWLLKKGTRTFNLR